MNFPEIATKREVVQKIVYLKGLNCANCAAKIEKKVRDLEEVDDVIINIAEQKMYLRIFKTGVSKIMDQVRDIVTSLEPHIKVYENNDQREEDNDEDEMNFRYKIIQIGIGASFFVMALFLKLPIYIELSLFLISYLIIGGEVIFRAGQNIFKGQIFDENFLISIATIGAFIIREYPEAVAVMLFYQIGELFQDISVNRSRRSIRALLDIRPEYANIERNGELVKVKPEQIKIGDVIVVKPGERVPLDGIVIEGQSMVDTSALTGESVPRSVEVDDELLAGYINISGLLTLKVTRTFAESTVTKILDMVQNASSRKAPTEKFITKFARYYTPVVVFAALIIAVIPPLFIPGASFFDWLYRGLVFLVISCPCALVISIPLGYFGGIGSASRQGILIKGSNYLEALNQVKTIVFDKTGTLTQGVFKVSQIVPEENISEKDLLYYAALAETHSNHPIAKSILEYYGEPMHIEKSGEYKEIPGHGIEAIIDGKHILAGNEKLMQKHGINYNPQITEGTVVYVAVDGKYLGHIIIADKIKKDAKEAIYSLRRLGVRELIMLTGDRQEIGEKVAKELKLDRVYAELLPDEKVEKIEEMVQRRDFSGKLAFVGDGINDAPVLARADVGVAMGGLGSDAAIEAADVVLMTDEPSKLVKAIQIARKTRAIVWQNIIFALGVKGFVLFLGAMGHATMWEAVFADVGVALIAVFNALRIIRVD
ncbi:cadmium-translocating P-type ATPase [Anoxybacter fermentans]|uniref:Cadmium-translocating P-type ATPase n=1 Tax=Anoxybacter fermentans TaxID=1323375 RepID=A0A3S9SWD5_9FIRM|nr:heavy metal translocating P-type ATPase [Anoxybacter fermentans]AZR72633.1 cadmium-translocating P-type ATPase [Anoxybacter fermentans]